MMEYLEYSLKDYLEINNYSQASLVKVTEGIIDAVEEIHILG